jgi:alpha-L-arabinofuranosidase
MAMETQLSNLLQSLFETDGEKFMKTATFYVMKLYREHLEQYLVDGACEVTDGEADVICSATESGDRVVITAVNRDLYSSATLKLSDEIAGMKLAMADIIHNENVRAYNTYDKPYEICDKAFDVVDTSSITLPPHSIVRLVFEK